MYINWFNLDFFWKGGALKTGFNNFEILNTLNIGVNFKVAKV